MELSTKYPVSLEMPVVWGDLDALGHVNNIKYFRYFESGRIAYFERLGISVGTSSLTAQGAPILASTACEFRLPLTYPDSVRIEAGVTRLGRSSFTMVYRVLSLTLQKEAAQGQGVLVWFDYTTQKSTPIPDALRDRITSLEGG